MHAGFSLLTLFPGRVGGSETYVQGLLREFSRGNGPERVTVLANRHVAAAYRSAGAVAVREVSSYRAGNRDAGRLLAMLFARALPGRVARAVPSGLDVLHYPVTVPIPSTRTPTVVTLHDVQHLDLPQLFSAAERRLRRWSYDGSARAATRVITVSEFSRSRIVDALGLPRDRVDVVHHGIDHARFRPDGPGGPPPGLPARYVVYPANLWPHKNHERLIEALARAQDRHLALALTGSTLGAERALWERAARAGVEERVHLLGRVAPEDLPALYRGARAMVFPSLYEGFGAPPLEAMACALPVAASARASLPEVVGDAALLFDPEDPAAIAAAIDRIVEDEPLRGRLRAAGLQRAQGFTWEASALRHRSIYERAAATSPPRRPFPKQ